MKERAEIVIKRRGRRDKKKKREGKREKKCACFSVTTPQTKLFRIDLFSAFREGHLQPAVVSREKHDDGGFHLHAFLRFRADHKQLLSEVKDFLFLKGFSALDVQTNFSEKLIVYITKEDKDPILYNVPVHKCHYAFQKWKFITSSDTFDPNNAFIRQHRNLFNYIQAAHNAYWGEFAVAQYKRIKK